MKKFLFLATAFATLCCIVSCSKDDTPPETPQIPAKEKPDEKTDPEKPTPDQPDTPITGGDELVTIDVSHYILSFAQPDRFVANSYDNLFVHIGYNRNNIAQYYDFYQEQDAEKYPDEAAAYKALCERYKDVAYKQERTIDIIWGPYYYSYLINNFVSIDVVSAADYDSDHPAGTSLKDICQLVSMSPRDYIASGYTDTYDWSVWPEYFPEKKESDGFYGPANKPFCKSLSECTPEDMILMGEGTSNIFMLRFIKAPDTGSKLQRFTVTMTDETGMTYTAETDVCEWN